jgi:hypothetical protein
MPVAGILRLGRPHGQEEFSSQSLSTEKVLENTGSVNEEPMRQAWIFLMGNCCNTLALMTKVENIFWY